MPLPALEARIHVVQSLLLLLSKLFDKGSHILNVDGLALKTGVNADRQGHRLSVGRDSLYSTSCGGSHSVMPKCQMSCFKPVAVAASCIGDGLFEQLKTSSTK